MAKKLHYFDINGRAEPIRYMLHYGTQQFEDIRYGSNEWPIQSVKDMLPYGAMPLYEEGNRKLNQSVAIARYVGSRNNLLPSDPWEQAVLDAAVLNMLDFSKQILDISENEDPANKDEKKKKMAEVIEYFFSRFEKELKANNGFLGKKLSWADFMLVATVESIDLFLGVDIEKNNIFPTVTALLKKIRSLPGIKEYIEKRPPYAMS